MCDQQTLAAIFIFDQKARSRSIESSPAGDRAQWLGHWPEYWTMRLGIHGWERILNRDWLSWQNSKRWNWTLCHTKTKGMVSERNQGGSCPASKTSGAPMCESLSEELWKAAEFLGPQTGAQEEGSELGKMDACWSGKGARLGPGQEEGTQWRDGSGCSLVICGSLSHELCDELLPFIQFPSLLQTMLSRPRMQQARECFLVWCKRFSKTVVSYCLAYDWLQWEVPFL